MSAVDEILAAGRYTDRRGRVWKQRRSGVWAHAERLVPVLGVLYSTLLPDQMRLLIERDQHRDECPGLALCRTHPVPFVILWPMPTAIPARTTIGRTCMNHERAFNEARLMAVEP